MAPHKGTTEQSGEAVEKLYNFGSIKLKKFEEGQEVFFMSCSGEGAQPYILFGSGVIEKIESLIMSQKAYLKCVKFIKIKFSDGHYVAEKSEILSGTYRVGYDSMYESENEMLTQLDKRAKAFSKAYKVDFELK